jgi:hypothetical protein
MWNRWPDKRACPQVVPRSKIRDMPKFRLRDRVRRIGQQETRTVEEIREGAGTEPMYSVQLGLDFTTRVWVKESELESAPDFIRPDPTS